MSNSLKRTLRYALGILVAFMALNAFAGGYYALSGAKGVPMGWLNGSPFQDYFIPGLVLMIVVGGAFLIAAIAVLADLRIARRATFISVIMVIVWLLVQVSIIGYVSWMQPTTAAISLLIFFMAYICLEVKQDDRSTGKSPNNESPT